MLLSNSLVRFLRERGFGWRNERQCFWPVEVALVLVSLTGVLAVELVCGVRVFGMNSFRRDVTGVVIYRVIVMVLFATVCVLLVPVFVGGDKL